MNIEQQIFPQTEPSYYTDSEGHMHVYLKQRYKDLIIPENLGLPQDFTVQAPGTIFQIETIQNNKPSSMPVQFEKSKEQSEYFILQFHMNSDDLGDVYRSLDVFSDNKKGLNMNVLAIEYPGQGTYKNQGVVDEDRLVQDATVLFDYVKSHFNISDDNIFVFGQSIGTGIALKLGAVRDPKSIILVSPIQNIRTCAEKQMGICSVLVKNSFNSPDQADKIKCKVLMIHGGKDSIVYVKHSISLQQLSDKFELEILSDKGHHDITDSILEKITTNWLKNNKIYDKNQKYDQSKIKFVINKNQYRNVSVDSQSKVNCLRDIQESNHLREIIQDQNSVN